MIKIKCNDEFVKDNIVNLLDQKKFFLSFHNNNKHLFCTKIIMKDNILDFIIEDEKISFRLPKSFNIIFEDFFDLISNKTISFQGYEYYPFKSLIKKNSNNIFLSEIQNTIMCNLLLNLDTGIKKIDLIKTIWPNDKDIFFNKLDTHLTNLKNYINSESTIDLKFMSKSGLIKLIIN
ncbi:MAG: hypothetical protein CBD62_01345 [Candidatus Pelagibacter sp. TMED202]|nr:MAG: hypothetical protein CBD62_01345 [Candidatus Pelagibacter sp. TMED202]|tara:strand:- start:4533 stop:5063 length:531 start_codon:yes stop_codon:yes gene_type:complete